MNGFSFVFSTALLSLGAATPLSPAAQWTPKQESLARAMDVLDTNPVIDGHNDFPMGLRDLLQNDLTNFNFDMDLSSIEPWASYYSDHTDLPRLRAGKVGGQFWSSYISCDASHKDAVQLFMEQVDVTKRLVDENPNDMAFVTTAQGIEDAFAAGKIASLVGVESGHAIDSSLAVLRMFYDVGARYMTLTHSCNTPWADSSTSEDGNEPVRSAGLSAFGVDVVTEMNRLGMLVDLSHVSTATMNDALDAARAPVMFSHSSARAVKNSARNVPDDVLERVAINEGIVMVNFYSCFIVDDCDNNPGTVQDVANHINHIRSVAGVDNVGLGGDFCGIESAPVGLSDSSMYPNLFAALIEDPSHEWTDEDLAKLSSGNLLRVLKDVEAVAASLSGENPQQDWIEAADFDVDETACMTSY